MTVKPGTYPSATKLLIAEEWERRGLPDRRDTKLVAQSADIGIWYTESSAKRDVPKWLPPFGDGRGLYRGFDVRKLQAVLETGLDVPAGAAFFASGYRDKAWEYPLMREIAAMLVLDHTRCEKSYVLERSGATSAAGADLNLYPEAYGESGWTVRTRFERRHGTRTFLDEQMYGHWIPGDARAALLGVVVGGPYSMVRELLSELAGLVDLLDD
ncbi:hypothetical protein [Mycolicibacterium sp. J2]|uniref:hypothetical protein n=1 Tax=Mycolicibacterium sp. J2 TaxID=2993511 RepID=UPI00224B871C|nr:hypothetical protein [Mycolicibacterium sp. J2]MCX2715272.1 hypothetical protein [Mycolicibacterium sp. J2]